MDALVSWLEKEFWNFNLGRNQFDGYSEGLCLLAGIDPEESKTAKGQYGPVFLPGSIRSYGYERITWEEQWYLKEAIDRHIDDLKSLQLKGRVHCHEALELCVKNKLDPPWLDAANNDFECAKRLPAKLRTNSEIILRINRRASSKGGSNRAKKNHKTQMLDTIGLQEFEMLREQGFPGCCFKSKKDHPNATAIANKIYHVLGKMAENNENSLPEITTVENRVRDWMKNSSK